MKLVLRIVLVLMLFFSMAAPALAADWNVEFSFDGPGRTPSAGALRDYIMGCVPFGGRGSFVPPPPPPRASEGPYRLTTPDTVSENQIYSSLLSCPLKPPSVTGIAITSDDD